MTASTNTLHTGEVRIEHQGGAALNATLVVPQSAVGIVVCLSASDALRWRGWASLQARLATALNAEGTATLALEPFVLEGELPRAGASASDSKLEAMATRLTSVTRWLLQYPDTDALSIGYFAPGETAAAAALSAIRTPDYIDAIVAVRPRLEPAGDAIGKVRAPTLVVESDSEPSPALSDMLARFKVEHSVERLPKQRFEQSLTSLACRWFVRHLSAGFHSTPVG